MKWPGVWRHDRLAQRGEEGLTLTELAVAMAVFMIVIVITIPVLNTFYSLDNSVNATVTSVNQILPATTTFERYLRSAVQPAPPKVVTPGVPGIPVPLFAPVTGSNPQTFQMGSNSMSFYSNVGNAYGPELVVATATGPNAKGLYTLTITSKQADNSSCPGAAAPMSTSATSVCTYNTNPAKPIATIAGVTNGVANSATPIFQYSIASNTNGTPQWVSPYTIPLGWQCTSAAVCNPASLTAVQLTINTQSTFGSPTSISTVVYFQAANYTATVG